jgi:hypothetical protein
MARYELRQYEVRGGQMPAWLELMKGEVSPAQTTSHRGLASQRNWRELQTVR